LEARAVLPKHLITILKIKGFHEQLPKNHQMLVLYRDLLRQTHPNQEKAVKNYVALISRVFKYVSSAMEKSGKPPQHWSDMLQEHKLIIQYLEK
jgi:hypothetical protein